MNKLTLKTLTVVFLLLLSQSVVYSQKVAVVLSGGGAKGACHVGLLKALEENDIPIDYIAGTSMGAIVAGLYAAGYSPEEMEALMTSEEFKGWAKGVIDPEYVYYYKKDPNDPSWISVPIEISPKKFKPKLPTNLVLPYEMDFQFIRIFADAGAAANYNFDSLFVPFRCVAADITANQPYIARKGNLENAIRASMTFPLYFKPITIDGHLMFDGGIFNNFPVDVVLEDFQPDYVIGSKAAGDYSIPNPDDIISQIEGLVMNKVPYQIPEGVKGIMVAPQLIKVEVNDFSQAKSFIDSGYVATTVLMDSIKKNVSRRESKEERRMKREAFNNRKPDMFIDQVIVTGVKPAQADYIRKLIVHHPKQRLFSEMKEDYYRLITDNRFRSVLPRLKFNPQSGYYDLTFEVERATPLELQFGGIITSSPNTEGYLQGTYYLLGENALNISLNGYFGRFYLGGRIGARFDFPFQNPYFLEMDMVSYRYHYFPSGLIFLDDVLSSNVSRYDDNITGIIGWPITNKGVFKINGVTGDWETHYYHTNAVKRTDVQDKTLFRYFKLGAELDFNTLNQRQYATAGSRLNARLNFGGGTEYHTPGTTSFSKQKAEFYHSFMDLQFTYDNYFAKSGPFTFGMLSECVFTTLPRFRNYTSTMILMPQFSPFPDAKVRFLENLRSQSYLAGGLKILYSFSNAIHMRVEGYYFQQFRKIFQNEKQGAYFGPWLSHHGFTMTSAIVAHTFLGPLSLNLNYFGGETSPWSFTVNFGYYLFHKEGLN